MTRRIGRVEKNLQRVIAQIIDEELQPPHMVSVVTVTCDSGLTSARVMISIYAKTKNQIPEQTIEYLEQRKSFIRRKLSARTNMRRTPELTFVIDTSIEDGQRMLDMISDLPNYT